MGGRTLIALKIAGLKIDECGKGFIGSWFHLIQGYPGGIAAYKSGFLAALDMNNGIGEERTVCITNRHLDDTWQLTVGMNRWSKSDGEEGCKEESNFHASSIGANGPTSRSL